MSRLANRVRHLVREKRHGLSQLLFQSHLRRSGVELGPGCYVARGSRISARTSIGRGTRVNGPVVFKGSQAVCLGNYCAIGDGVRMITSNHRTDLINLQNRLQRTLGLQELHKASRPISVGHNVWIGDAAIILSGVNIGDGAIVGAGAIVTRDVPAFSIVAGSPAEVKRMRFAENVIHWLQSLEWWAWTEAEMRSQLALFTQSPTPGGDIPPRRK